MVWNRARAQERIRKHIQTAPEVDPGADLARFAEAKALAKAMGQWPRSRAVEVEGVHLYGVLLDFDDVVADQGRETEDSHGRVLRFLNVYYRVWDGIVNGDDAYRVDYHGPRLHAIVTAPTGDAAEQLQRAIALARKLNEAAKRVGDAYGFPSRIRFGLDHGKCLAMSTGRSLEQDVLFLGSPANHAAKLAGGGEQPGIFLTERAQRILGHDALVRTSLGQMMLRESVAQAAAARHPFARIGEVAETVASEAGRDPVFRFHRSTPPLVQVKFSDLKPSNSVRMGMSSIFADIHGFTNYVDGCIAGGAEKIKFAVRNIHVLREELNSVVQEDFGGKRVRFIGDCIHAMLAQREHEDDATESVRDAALCAAGMKSSFQLVQQTLGGIDELDLAIGIEYGPVPVSRIGEPGDESIRCAAGRATIVAERVQQEIEAGGVKFGPVAWSAADWSVRRHFGEHAYLPNYAAAADLLGARPSPVAATVARDPTARSHGRG